ncbi:hypothetical protein TPHA_0I00280 [Tetrapisispora phaffii CBS 4417]|uniref:N-acetylglucosaminylphosphatidylinositol deacetylase n=1 Tax=Tetrapisispora phaffii (strain ATCC 24235 / CBS 4417 / NBRC 1672 / NRRL Y-8282 / UCD 70-5) TaxID=1071381 RepID=G8BXA7_TETPH|nr:hypothetical protein TPHA_0I00280 [Tetrapisispora phaffii CBS 4417]CCE64535.1 hypothetical protein TPHA_0I00280 [Tetrapisispora phaffii CBS 4417]
MGILFKLFKCYCILSILYIWLTPHIEDLNLKSFYSNVQLNISQQSLKSVNLIIAHPDDEVMFFTPTLLQLDDILPTHVPFNVICLSKGVDVDGRAVGDLRSNEIMDSLTMLLGHRRAGLNREVKLHQFEYEDGMDKQWDISKVVTDIQNTISMESNVDGLKHWLLTFDAQGVSEHPNHIACYDAMMTLKQKSSNPGDYLLMTLNSYGSNIILKYSSFLPVVFKLLINIINDKFRIFELKQVPFLSMHKEHDQIQFINTFPHYIMALSSMLNSHTSQMVWFRYGWWSFSRFVFVNDLHIIDL